MYPLTQLLIQCYFNQLICSATCDRSPFLPQTTENSVLNKRGSLSPVNKSKNLPLRLPWKLLGVRNPDTLSRFSVLWASIQKVTFSSTTALEPHPLCPHSRMQDKERGRRKTHLPRSTFSNRSHYFHLYPSGQNFLAWPLFQMVVGLAKVRDSTTKRRKDWRVTNVTNGVYDTIRNVFYF